MVRLVTGFAALAHYEIKVDVADMMLQYREWVLKGAHLTMWAAIVMPSGQAI